MLYARNPHTRAFMANIKSDSKSSVVSVRVEPRVKQALQAAAEREMRSQANMVEVIVLAYCRANNIPVQGDSPDTLPKLNVRKKK